jgi:hypothetical protein
VRFRTTAILLLAVLLLGALISRLERKTRYTRERAEAARRALGFQAEAVSSFEIQSSNLLVGCAREDGHWMIARPLRARADAAAVDQLLYGLQGLERGEVITPRDLKNRDLGPDAYGLALPRYRIVLGFAHHRQTIRVGREAPLGGSVYIQEEGQENIVAVDRGLLDLLPASVSALRDRSLLPGSPEMVQRLEIRRGDGFIQLARAERGRWMIRQPLVTRASPAAVQRLLEQLFLLRAAEFLPGETTDSTAHGFDDPDLRIGVALGGGGEAAVLFGNPIGRGSARLYALAQPGDSVCVVEAAQVEPLNVALDDLRDRKLTTLEARDVNQIVIEEGERKLELRHVSGEWRLIEPRRWKADDQRVLEFLAVWTAPVIQNFFPAPTNLAASGLEPPALKIRFACQDEEKSKPEARPAIAGAEEESALWISAPVRAAGPRLVLVKPEGFVGEIPESLLLSVSTDPFFYRDRAVLGLDPDEVVRISVSRDGGTSRIEREASGEFAPAVGMESGAVNREAVQDLLRTLRELRAERFVGSASDEGREFGLNDRPDVLSLGLKGMGGLGKTLYIGAPAGSETRYARIQGQEGIFELSDRDCELLLPRLIEPTAPSGDAVHGTNQVDHAGDESVR